MDLWTMIVLVTAIGVGAGMFSDYMKTKRATARSQPDGETMDLQAEVEALRERVAVLEKIVTDERFNLAREIDSLEKASSSRTATATCPCAGRHGPRCMRAACRFPSACMTTRPSSAPLCPPSPTT